MKLEDINKKCSEIFTRVALANQVYGLNKCFILSDSNKDEELLNCLIQTFHRIEIYVGGKSFYVLLNPRVKEYILRDGYTYTAGGKIFYFYTGDCELLKEDILRTLNLSIIQTILYDY